jgi:alanyl-tRNA synthetase
MSKLVGGGGGGKPGIAQGGGTDASKIGEALEKGLEMVRKVLNSNSGN